MPRGDKSAYTDKQKRQAEHIEEGYEHRGVPEGEAERRAWATVNKETGGGKKSGSGRGEPVNTAPSRKGGSWVARLRPHVPPQRVPRLRRKLPRPESAKPQSVEPDSAGCVRRLLARVVIVRARPSR